MSYEEAEFSKIAINMTLISQVENTNKLNAYAQKHGLRWDKIQDVLMTDKRIGKESYLTPGRWQDSKHLMRDWVTFESS
jgi:UDP-glucose 6-dehydrogenase